MTPVREAACGRWRGVLPPLGLPESFLQDKHGPCPLGCGGKRSWRWDDKDGSGSWICTHCGAGDGVSLVMKMTGLGFRDAAKRIEELLPETVALPGKPAADPRAQRRAMARLWEAGKPLDASAACRAWWAHRTGVMPSSDALRSHGDVMLARVTDASGKGVQVHRTFLTPDGRKRTDMPDCRLLMPGRHPEGSAVRLGEPDKLLGIAEGIETAWAVTCLFKVPCWAALTAGRLETWEPPAGVQVVIFGDRDGPKSFAGETAAYALAKRLTTKRVTVHVELPDAIGDWNDVLSDRLHQGEGG